MKCLIMISSQHSWSEKRVSLMLASKLYTMIFGDTKILLNARSESLMMLHTSAVLEIMEKDRRLGRHAFV